MGIVHGQAVCFQIEDLCQTDRDNLGQHQSSISILEAHFELSLIWSHEFSDATKGNTGEMRHLHVVAFVTDNNFGWMGFNYETICNKIGKVKSVCVCVCVWRIKF